MCTSPMIHEPRFSRRLRIKSLISWAQMNWSVLPSSSRKSLFLMVLSFLSPTPVDPLEYFIKRNLYPNVDFYSGLIYKAMGFPTDFFPVLFCMARTAGWLAHWYEQNMVRLWLLNVQSWWDRIRFRSSVLLKPMTESLQETTFLAPNELAKRTTRLLQRKILAKISVNRIKMKVFI